MIIGSVGTSYSKLPDNRLYGLKGGFSYSVSSDGIFSDSSDSVITVIRSNFDGIFIYDNMSLFIPFILILFEGVAC